MESGVIRPLPSGMKRRPSHGAVRPLAARPRATATRLPRFARNDNWGNRKPLADAPYHFPGVPPALRALLFRAFRPDGEVRRLRSYLRQRATLVEYATHHVQHMQKALTRMNVKLHHVIWDITGKTGMDIMEAIVGGEWNPRKLARLRDPRIKAVEKTIANRAAAALRPAANALHRSDSALGTFLRREKPSWVRPRPSLPRLTSWPGSSTPCCATARSTWTLGPNTTKLGISSGRCALPSVGRRNWAITGAPIAA